MNVCAKDLYLIQGAFLPQAWCSWDRLRKHCHPEHDQTITEEE